MSLKSGWHNCWIRCIPESPQVSVLRSYWYEKKKYSQVNKSHFHKKGFVTRKSPIPLSERFVSKDAKQLSKNGWSTFLVLISVSQSIFLRFMFRQISEDLILEAGVATGARKFDYITPILKQLHWLPVVRQLEVRDAVMAFKCFHGLAPTYLRVIRRQVRPISSNFRRFDLRDKLTLKTSSYIKEGRFHSQNMARCYQVRAFPRLH